MPGFVSFFFFSLPVYIYSFSFLFDIWRVNVHAWRSIASKASVYQEEGASQCIVGFPTVNATESLFGKSVNLWFFERKLRLYNIIVKSRKINILEINFSKIFRRKEGGGDYSPGSKVKYFTRSACNNLPSLKAFVATKEGSRCAIKQRAKNTRTQVGQGEHRGCGLIEAANQEFPVVPPKPIYVPRGPWSVAWSLPRNCSPPFLFPM